MTTIRQMLPQVAQPFTEAIVGAGLGALVSRFVLKGDMTTGALVGGVAGYGLALTRAKGAFPFTATAGGAYVGDSVYQFPTRQMGFVQPYQGMQQPMQMQPQYPQYPQYEEYAQPQQEIIEEVVEEERPRDWRRDRGWGGGGWGHHRGWGHEGRGWGRGWGHGWRH